MSNNKSKQNHCGYKMAIFFIWLRQRCTLFKFVIVVALESLNDNFTVLDINEIIESLKIDKSTGLDDNKIITVVSLYYLSSLTYSKLPSIIVLSLQVKPFEFYHVTYTETCRLWWCRLCRRWPRDDAQRQHALLPAAAVIRPGRHHDGSRYIIVIIFFYVCCIHIYIYI